MLVLTSYFTDKYHQLSGGHQSVGRPLYRTETCPRHCLTSLVPYQLLHKETATYPRCVNVLF